MVIIHNIGIVESFFWFIGYAVRYLAGPPSDDSFGKGRFLKIFEIRRLVREY